MLFKRRRRANTAMPANTAKPVILLMLGNAAKPVILLTLGNAAMPANTANAREYCYASKYC